MYKWNGKKDRSGGGAIVVGVVGPVAVLTNVPGDVKSVATTLRLVEHKFDDDDFHDDDADDKVKVLNSNLPQSL